MKYAIATTMTAFLAAGAWVGYATGNDFILYLFGLLAFSPVPAAVTWAVSTPASVARSASFCDGLRHIG